MRRRESDETAIAPSITTVERREHQRVAAERHQEAADERA